MWEWIQESAYVKDSSYLIYTIRGGTFAGYYQDRPVYFRAYSYAINTYTDRGFRPVLYIR